MVLGGPLGEAPAWRGFALDPVGRRRSMLAASLSVGLAWAAWHRPLLPARPGELAPGILGIVSASVVLTWLYRASGACVLLPLLMHTAQNTFGGELAGPMFTGADATRMAWIRGGLPRARGCARLRRPALQELRAGSLPGGRGRAAHHAFIR